MSTVRSKSPKRLKSHKRRDAPDNFYFGMVNAIRKDATLPLGLRQGKHSLVPRSEAFDALYFPQLGYTERPEPSSSQDC